jgi:hypothetical protein
MAKFTKLRNRIVQLSKEINEQKLEAELINIIHRNQQVIIDLNIGQLMKGVDSKGASLGQYKNPKYAKMKKTLNPKGVVDLRLTGHFHQNFFVASEVPLIIFSYDIKTDELVKKYGAAIFGLTKDSKKAFMVGYVRKELQNYYKRIFYLR